MTIYKGYIVDRRAANVIAEQTIVARDEKEAMIAITLTEEQRQGVKQGEISVILDAAGSFEKYTKKVRVVEE